MVVPVTCSRHESRQAQHQSKRVFVWRTLPKMVCFRSSQGDLSSVMKNCARDGNVSAQAHANQQLASCTRLAAVVVGLAVGHGNLAAVVEVQARVELVLERLAKHRLAA